jgi:hypothetical protein
MEQMQMADKMIKATQGFSHIKIKSVTDPLFMYGGICLSIAATTSWFAPQWISIICACFGGLFLTAGLAFYWYFALKDPKFLRSEVFHQNMAVIENMGTKENTTDMAKTYNLPNTENPENDAETTNEG